MELLLEGGRVLASMITGALVLLLGLYGFNEYKNIQLINVLNKALFLTFGFTLAYGFSQLLILTETASQANLVILGALVVEIQFYIYYRVANYLIGKLEESGK